MKQPNNDNPLLDLTAKIPFGRISAEHFEPAVEVLMENARSKLATVGAIESAFTWSNTMGILDTATEELGVVMGIMDHLEGLLEDPELRAVYNKIQPQVAAFYSSIPLDSNLWMSIKGFAQTNEASELDAVKAHYLKKTMDEFRRSGANLEGEAKTQLQSIDVKLAETTNAFSQNVGDATDAFEFIVTDEARLAGLPPDAIALARSSAQSIDKEGWRFTLQAPSYVPVMTYLDDAEMREHLYRAYNTRGTTAEFDNRALLNEILELRARKASILGYDDVSDLYLEARMVGNGKKAREFVDDLRARSAPHATKEHEALNAFRRDLEGDSAPDIMPWDTGYYAEKQRKALYDFNAEVVRPYLELECVLSGLFDLFTRLYGIEFTALNDWPVWHESVRAYAVNEDDGTEIGVFYLDLFPRAGKRGGAWMRPMLTGESVPETTPNVGVVCCNMTAPSDTEPALLRHREVETLFHEFGHLMHHLLSRVSVRSLTGTNVPWDFVELPSQIMENWCWERPALDLFARHYKTDEVIPDDLFQRMMAARTFRAGYQMMRQLGFATIDLALHRDFRADRDGHPADYARQVASQFDPAPLPADYSMITAFLHLFAGPVAYASGYYSYKWAEVLEADAFSRFKNEGIFSREVGDQFRRKVLEPGGSRDPMMLFTDFMGREPELSALLTRSGLDA